MKLERQDDGSYLQSLEGDRSDIWRYDVHLMRGEFRNIGVHTHWELKKQPENRFRRATGVVALYYSGIQGLNESGEASSVLEELDCELIELVAPGEGYSEIFYLSADDNEKDEICMTVYVNSNIMDDIEAAVGVGSTVNIWWEANVLQSSEERKAEEEYKVFRYRTYLLEERIPSSISEETWRPGQVKLDRIEINRLPVKKMAAEVQTVLQPSPPEQNLIDPVVIAELQRINRYLKLLIGALVVASILVWLR